MYNCVIVDDEELARELIKSHLSQLDNFRLLASCASAIEASKVLQEQSIDLLFLDIEMPVLKGTDFLKNLINKPKVIFTTAYRDYAIDGFDLNALDYLLKPITFERFFNAIEKFLSQETVKQETLTQKPKQKSFIYIKKNRKQIKLKLEEILYVESLKDYLQIHLENKVHEIKYRISAFEENLDNRFLRTHRSFIINRDKVTAFTKNDIEIGKIEIPIGESYKAEIEKRIHLSD